MGLNVGNPAELYEQLRTHVGHEIVCVTYGGDANVALECVTCSEILLTEDNPARDTWDDDDENYIDDDDEFEPEEGDDDFDDFFRSSPTWMGPDPKWPRSC